MSERTRGRAPAADVAAGWPEPPILALNRDRALKAFDWGALAAVGVSVAYGLLWETIDLHLGLIAVAVMGGWLIGAAVSHGAWKDSLHLPDRRLRLLAAALGASAWLGGAIVAYFVSQLLFPNPTTSLAERLSISGFNQYVTGVFDPVQGVALLTLAYLSWRSVR